jgi:hypothetical protein
VSARNTARVAKLRRMPDELFAEEARRRGYRPAEGRYLVQKKHLRKIVEDLKLKILLDSETSDVRQLSGIMHTLLRLISLNEIMTERFDRGETDIHDEREAESRVRIELWNEKRARLADSGIAT